MGERINDIEGNCAHETGAAMLLSLLRYYE